MLKKILAAALAVIIAVSALTATAFAESGSLSLVQTSYADKDGNFTVEVRLDGNPGIRNMSVNIRFNYQELDFVEVKDAGLMDGFYYVENGQIVSLTWTGNGQDHTDVGLLATVTFKALATPDTGSILYASVSALSGNGIIAQVDGNTTLVYFGSDRNNEAPDPSTGTDPNAPSDETTDSEEQTEELFEEDETEIVEDVTEAPVTTEAPTTTPEPTTTPAPTTKATTTRRRSTTTERETDAPETTTEVTTTEATTTEAPTTTPEPTEILTTTASEVTTTETTPMNDAAFTTTTSEEGFSEVYTEGVDNKTANRGTLLLAVIAIALTGVVVIGIEMYRRRQ